MVNSNNNNVDCNMVEGIGHSSLIYSLIFSLFIGLATPIIYNISGVDSFISGIIGAIVGIIPFGMIIYIMKNSNGLNIIDANVEIYGKFLGTIINIVLSVLAFLVFSITLYNISLFLNTQYMPDTSDLYIKILIVLPVIYAASKNIAVISRISQILLFVIIATFFISAAGLISSMDFYKVLPIMADGIKKPALASLVYMCYGILPISLITIVPLNQIKNKKNMVGKMFIIYLVANIINILMFLFTTSIFGPEVISIYKYPEYIALKSFSLFSILERVESTLGLQFVFCQFIFMVLLLFFLGYAGKRAFKQVKREQTLPFIFAILALVVSTLMFKNSNESMYFFENYLPYIAGIPLLALLVITCIVIFLKKKISQNNGAMN